MMKKHIGVWMVLATVLLLSYSCGQKSQKKEIKDSILASVNGETIHETEFKRQAAGKALSKDSSEAAKKEVLDELIDNEILFQEAIQENYHRKENVKRQIVRQFLNDKMKSKFEFTDAELQKHFDENKDELQRIRASHILIKPEKKGDATAEANALEKAQALLKKIKAGEDFAELAKTHSQDPGSARRGGDLRFFNRRMMVKPFSDAAFDLKNMGDVSDVVKTDFGYHIIKLTGKQDGIEPLRHIIKAALMKEKRESAQAEIVASLRKKASVTVYDKNLEKAELAAKRETPQNPHGKMDQEKLKQMMERMKLKSGNANPANE